MTNTSFGRTVAAIVCSVLLSATCLLGAVGPATTAGATMASGPVA